MKKIFSAGIIIAIILTVLAFSFMSYYTVDEQSVAIVYTLGKLTDIKSAGLHFKIPFVQRISKVKTTVQGMQIGYDTVSEFNPTFEPLIMMTGDSNMVAMDFYIEWKIIDPFKADTKVEDIEFMIKNIIESGVREVVSSYTVDEVLTDGKENIQVEIKDRSNDMLEKYDLGIRIENVILQDSEPPKEDVKSAFTEVENAKQEKSTAINRAKEYSNNIIPEARSNADKITQEGEAYKESRVLEAEGQIARFNEIYKEYVNAPEITKERMYLETLGEILPNSNVIIDTIGNNTIIINSNSEVKSSYLLEKDSSTENYNENILEGGEFNEGN